MRRTTTNLESLRRQLAEMEESLRLIEERKAEYVLQSDIPLQLVKEERNLRRRIEETKAGIPQLEEALKGDERESLRKQLADAEVDLRLVRERIAEYPLRTDEPLSLVREERNLRQRIEELEARIRRLEEGGSAAAAALGGGKPTAPAGGSGAGGLGDRYYSCFISYSSKDEELAEKLHADLASKGVKCFYAPEDMKIGDPIRQRIDVEIGQHAKLLLVLSANSVASNWVESEVEAAFERERQTKTTMLFPIRLDEAVMETTAAWAAEIRRTRHIGDFRKWEDEAAYAKGLARVLRDLAK